MIQLVCGFADGKKLGLKIPITQRVPVMQVNPNVRQTSSASQSSGSIGISASAKERAERHYQRAQEQIKLKHPKLALQELRDAIAINPTDGRYHALSGKVHLDQGMIGMANISLREALKLNAEEPLALECMQKLQTQVNQPQPAETGLLNRVLGLLNQKL